MILFSEMDTKITSYGPGNTCCVWPLNKMHQPHGHSQYVPQLLLPFFDHELLMDSAFLNLLLRAMSQTIGYQATENWERL